MSFVPRRSARLAAKAQDTKGPKMTIEETHENMADCNNTNNTNNEA
jgi:hypothetical protein